MISRDLTNSHPTHPFGQRDEILSRRFPSIRNVIGVDYSGASVAGKTAWAAELTCETTFRASDVEPKFCLSSLRPLGKLARDDSRSTVNDYLVDRISQQPKTLWACDFPFGLPVELPLGGWSKQLAHVSAFRGSAKEFGLSLVSETEKIFGAKHVRRTTDSETATPFDCYHYRIIYQTFHGMRDVLAKVADDPGVSVLPFQYDKIDGRKTHAIVVEACPSSTLKRLGLPHQRYKQSGGKTPDEIHKRTRRTIMKTLSKYVEISHHRRKVIMNDPGGDALDAVLAAVGGWQGFARSDHRAVAEHARYPREGRVYC